MLIWQAKKEKGGNNFWCMNLEELMTGEDSELAEMCSILGGKILRLEKWNSDKNSGAE